MGGLGLGGMLIPLALALISLGWYMAVIVLLYRIWKKVRHLPG